MSSGALDDELAHYVEEVALHFERSGLPRIAGRIVGLLLVCDPPERSAGQLAAELGVSKGSVSAMTRLLLGAGTIKRVARPGERLTYFALSDDGFERKLARRVEAMAASRALGELGLRLLEGRGAPDSQTKRLREFVAMYAFWEREMPTLLARWRAERRRLHLSI